MDFRVVRRSAVFCVLRMMAACILPMYCFVFVLFLPLSAPCADTLPEESPDQVWTVHGRQWTVEDERQYAKWVEANIDQDFFVRYQLPIDCADVLYAVRWIYARIAHLPAAATTYHGKLVGHWSTSWEHLSTSAEWYEDARFRAALLRVISETNTCTLPLDTYPIRIALDSVTPGTVFLSEAHAEMVSHISLDGSYAHPLQTLEANLPVRIQKLRQNSFFLSQPKSASHLGLLKFRWPIFKKGGWRYLPVEKHPFYSQEQYAPGFCKGYADYTAAISKRLDPTKHDLWEQTDSIIRTITRNLQERVQIVLGGYQHCPKGDCPEGSYLWEIYNSTSRDEMIVSVMDHLTQIIESNDLDKERIRGKMESVVLQVSQDRFLTVFDVYQNRLWLSHNPEDSIQARWGSKKCDMILSRIRDASESIRFLEMTYGEKDPDYANSQTQLQREIIRGLSAELDRSECRDSLTRQYAGTK